MKALSFPLRRESMFHKTVPHLPSGKYGTSKNKKDITKIFFMKISKKSKNKTQVKISLLYNKFTSHVVRLNYPFGFWE